MSTTGSLTARMPYFTGPSARIGTAVAAVVALVLPFMINDVFWLAILTTAGVYTLGAVSLNAVAGYLGEASLGQAFFLSVGCYAGVAAGMKGQLPLLGWVAVVLVVGALAGLVVAPLAMRLSGPHLIIITLGLVFLGQYVFSNWRGLTGGPGGTAFALPMSIGDLDFGALQFGGYLYSREQGLSLLTWIFVAIAMWWVHNIATSRRGRETRAVRDNPLAAQVAGVSVWRCKAGAFAVSGALAALAGALFAQQISYVEPEIFNFHLSIQFVAILVIGGSATAFGPAIGGVFVALIPALLTRYLTDAPFVLAPNDKGFGMTVSQLSSFTYAVLLVLFLLFEPRGINALITRAVGVCSRIATGHRSPSVPAVPASAHKENHA
ncbi:branched-chain amino acid ABC transporter permease [Streptomyces sp. NPDC086080]|uniref:branched-chain amino acid ABC transporter permease n=1 Tax=Streptomyces sp. NPDC086080 TaxID=3365748 RepID=UPI0037D0311A